MGRERRPDVGTRRHRDELTSDLSVRTTTDPGGSDAVPRALVDFDTRGFIKLVAEVAHFVQGSGPDLGLSVNPLISEFCRR